MNILAEQCVAKGTKVISCEADADVEIVNAAMALACSDKDVTIAADNTDVMIILLHWIYKQQGDL